MKKSFVLASVALVVCYAVGLITRLAASASVNSPTIPVIIGGIFASGLLLIAGSDYSRKPRFRVRAERKAILQATVPARTSAVDPATVWTYTTHSV